MYVHELITLLHKFPRESRVLLMDPQFNPRLRRGALATFLDEGIRLRIEPEEDPTLVLTVKNLPRNLEHLNEPEDEDTNYE